MKRFILIANIVIFIMYSIFMMYLNNSISRITPKFYVGEIRNYELYDKMTLVNVGTSHGSVSFDYDQFKDKVKETANFGNAGQSFYYDFRILSEYSDIIDDSTLIIVPVSFHSFCMVDEFAPFEAIYERNTNLFGLTAIQEKIRFVSNANLDRSNLVRIVDKVDLSLGMLEIPNCNNSILMNNIKNMELILTTYNNVVLLTVPYNERYLYNEEEYKGFFSLVEEISIRYNAPYYNYSFNKELNREEYFYDRLHLNNVGQKKFMEYIYNDFIEKHLNMLSNR
jgi:hypothetical protein